MSYSSISADLQQQPLPSPGLQQGPNFDERRSSSRPAPATRALTCGTPPLGNNDAHLHLQIETKFLQQPTQIKKLKTFNIFSHHTPTTTADPTPAPLSLPCLVNSPSTSLSLLHNLQTS
ncbi:hypothetical protein ACFX1Q_046024 [Malus domestica]